MIDSQRIDFLAGEPHFLDHLLPVWRALDPEDRGTFYVRPGAAERATLELEEPPTVVDELREESGRLLYLVSLGDWRRSGRGKLRPVALGQHGAGQSYGNRHASYPGGIGFERAVGFVVPNHFAAQRWRRRYPSTPIAVVGCPKIDALDLAPVPELPPTAALSFHWRCKVAPEAGTVFDHYRKSLGRIRAELEGAGVRLLGHAHPNLSKEARPIFEEAGIEWLPTFAEVVERAHLYACDNSSTLFEFAALDRPVVVLNGPAFRKNVRHGLRFWDAAPVGVNVEGPAELAAGILTALEEPPELVAHRERALGHVYAFRDGTATARTIGALLRMSPSRCRVCGAPHATCGPSSQSRPVDVFEAPMSKRKGPLKLFPNPAGRGFLRLTDADARARGIIGGAPRPSSSIVSSLTLTGDAARLEEVRGRLADAGATELELEEALGALDEGLRKGDRKASEAIDQLLELSDEDLAARLEKLRAAEEPPKAKPKKKPEDKKLPPPTPSSGRRRRVGT